MPFVDICSNAMDEVWLCTADQIKHSFLNKRHQILPVFWHLIIGIDVVVTTKQYSSKPCVIYAILLGCNLCCILALWYGSDVSMPFFVICSNAMVECSGGIPNEILLLS